MNEKYLWELWRKCNHPHPKWGGDSMVWPMEFAELIIQDCIELLSKEYWSDGHEIAEAIELIQKHFGMNNETK